MNKLSILKSFLLLLLFSILAACGSSEPLPPTPELLTLTLITIDEEFTAEIEVIEQFEAENPHIQIERQTYAQFPQQYLLTDPPPDIMTIGPSSILIGAGQQGLLTDLSDLWAQSGLYEAYPQSFRSMSEAEGKQFFLPMAYSWAGFYYNASLFDEYGLTPPQTWDEFIVVADTLKAAGVAPIALAGESPFSAAIWFDYLNSRLNGPAFHSALIRGQESYLDDRVQAVFEIWAFLISEDYFLRGTNQHSDFDALTSILLGQDGRSLTSRRAGMVLTDPLALASIPPALRTQPGFFAFPSMDPSLQMGESMLVLGYMIPSGAAHVEEAIEFLTYMSQPAIQDQLYQPSETNLSYAPVRATDAGQYSDEIQQRMAVVLGTDVVDVPYFLGNPPIMQLVIVNALGEFLRDAERNEVDIEKILEQLEAGREAGVGTEEFVE